MQCGPSARERLMIGMGGMIMSIYSYKNANTDACPGPVNGFF